LVSENRHFSNAPNLKVNRSRYGRGLCLFGAWVFGDTSDISKLQFHASLLDLLTAFGTEARLKKKPIL
jgi:hypothetical protein